MSTVHRFMSLLRELLEERGERKKYPLASMFCDWSVHSKLNRSATGDELLDQLDQIWARSQNVDRQIQQLMTDISPAKLQAQIVALLTASFIDPSLVSDGRSCIKVFHVLIDDLKDKTVARREDKIKKLTAERLAKGYRHIADSFYFSSKDGETKFVLVAKQIEPASGGSVLLQMPFQISAA